MTNEQVGAGVSLIIFVAIALIFGLIVYAGERKQKRKQQELEDHFRMEFERRLRLAALSPKPRKQTRVTGDCWNELVDEDD